MQYAIETQYVRDAHGKGYVFEIVARCGFYYPELQGTLFYKTRKEAEMAAQEYLPLMPA